MSTHFCITPAMAVRRLGVAISEGGGLNGECSHTTFEFRLNESSYAEPIVVQRIPLKQSIPREKQLLSPTIREMITRSGFRRVPF